MNMNVGFNPAQQSNEKQKVGFGFKNCEGIATEMYSKVFPPELLKEEVFVKGIKHLADKKVAPAIEAFRKKSIFFRFFPHEMIAKCFSSVKKL